MAQNQYSPRISYLLFLFLFVVVTAQADIPKVISYQGKVTDAGGTPVPDGSYIMRFRIYNVSTNGNWLWSSGDLSVDVNGGVFNVILGESPQPALELDFDEGYWLQVRFDGVDQTPRQRLTAAGYAFMASGLVAGTVVTGDGFYPVISGTNTATVGNGVIGVRGTSSSTSGQGVYGEASATAGTAYGVYGVSYSTDGRGVVGIASATTGTTSGVQGVAISSLGSGVYGEHSATTGTEPGVLGVTFSTSGFAVGVVGRVVTTTPGGYSSGVRGINNGTGSNGIGVYGSHGGYGWGMYGEAYGGVGVYGRTTASSGTSYGVFGETVSSQGSGVYGRHSAVLGADPGVLGVTASTTVNAAAVIGRVESTTPGVNSAGVFAINNGTGIDGMGLYARHEGSGLAVYGETPTGWGVLGTAYATTGQGLGVVGEASSTNGYGVYYSGGLAGSGSKSCVVRTSQGPTLFYCQESTECWFEEFGEGQLTDGRCHIELHPLFLESVTIDASNPMKVFVELCGKCEGVYVEKGLTGFDVFELRDGHSNTVFDYRVVAKRKGFVEKRLDYCKAAETDPYLFPEFRTSGGETRER